MKMTIDELRQMIREHFRHGVSPHQRTSDSKNVLRAMQDNQRLQKAFDKLDQPRELAGLLEELIDATGPTREQIQQALSILYRHERPRRK